MRRHRQLGGPMRSNVRMAQQWVTRPASTYLCERSLQMRGQGEPIYQAAPAPVSRQPHRRHQRI